MHREAECCKAEVQTATAATSHELGSHYSDLAGFGNLKASCKSNISSLNKAKMTFSGFIVTVVVESLKSFCTFSILLKEACELRVPGTKSKLHK